MRMSCNGCRVLRKGCSDACTIRPCLQWIKSPDAQANATVFLAKFYGRAGLLNLLAAPPADHLRPAVFRSLLYEACGRIVNPVYGSVGLLWSGQWQACQAAVEAVLKGGPIVQVDAATSEAAAAPPLLGGRRYDIRHVARDPDADAAADLLRVARGGGRGRKRAASSSTSSKSKPSSSSKRASLGDNDPSRKRPGQEAEEEPEPVPVVVEEHDEESAGSHDQHHHLQAQQGSEDTDMEAASHAHSHVSQAEPETEPQSHAPPPPPPVSSQQQADQEDEEVGLELTLGLEPRVRQQPKSSRCDHSGLSAASSLICLRLQLPA